MFLLSHGTLPPLFPHLSGLVSCKKERRQRDFSGAQEGNCNYGFSANVRGLSWFWSGCSLRAPRSVVSSYASQAHCLMEKRALAATGRGLEASGRCWVSHMQEGNSIPCPLHLNPLGHIPSFLRGVLALFVNATSVIGRPDSQQTPRHRLGRSEKRLQSTHRWWQRRESA